MLKVFVAEDVEYRETGGAGDGVAAKGGEKFHAVGEGCGDFRSGDDGSKRKSVADGFAKDHDLRNGLLRFESPKVSA